MGILLGLGAAFSWGTSDFLGGRFTRKYPAFTVGLVSQSSSLLALPLVDAINTATAPVIYAANIMTQPGETGEFSLSDHLEAIFQHTELKRIDYVLFNSGHITDRKLKYYRSRGSNPVELDDRAAAGGA